ncbi:MAG: hypothetical protein L0271_04800, partial [Gemmatimonadetes bacterium]|nr:hypothetical protein [Gemmatimonadota bacterium]
MAAVLIAAPMLIAAAFGKIVDPDSFRAAIEGHGLVPASLHGLLVVGVPVVELCFGVRALWLLARHDDGRAAALTLLTPYVLLLGYTSMLWMDPPVEPASCGCGLSVAPVQSWGYHVVLNGAVAALLAVCGRWTATPTDRIEA